MAKITCIVRAELFKKLMQNLSEVGIHDIYVMTGRAVTLAEPRGWRVLNSSSELRNEPVEVVSFLLPCEFESLVLALIIGACRLDVPGRGSVFSEHLTILEASGSTCLNENIDLEQVELGDLRIFSDFVAITCTVQRGHADDLVRLLLHLGIVPTVQHATGTGIRDKLGLLRIVLPREKDVVLALVGAAEADFVTEQLIQAGRLDKAGKGFVCQNPVNKGVIDFKTSNHVVGHAASVDQIIAAIDSIKGSYAWRQGATGLSQLVRRTYMTGSEVLININEGYSQELIKKIMAMGVTGATVMSPKTFSPNAQQGDRALPAREVIKIMLPDSMIGKVTEICRDFGMESEDKKALLLSGAVLKAFTYRRSETPKKIDAASQTVKS